MNRRPAMLVAALAVTTVSAGLLSTGTAAATSPSALPAGTMANLAPTGGGAQAAAGSQPWLASTISTVAGTGAVGEAGDGGPAAAAQVTNPRGLALAPGGGYAFAEVSGRVRLVGPDGTISTIAGIGTTSDSLSEGYAGDGGPAVAAKLLDPAGVAYAADGAMLIADTGNQVIRRVGADGIITTIAGIRYDTRYGYRSSGDGGPATAAYFCDPYDIAPLPDGGFLVADACNNKVRRVWPDGTITTVAGNGATVDGTTGQDGLYVANPPGGTGDGGPAVDAPLNDVRSVAVTPDGGFLLTEANYHFAVRKVDANGIISTVAGTGTYPTGASPLTGDGPATSVMIVPIWVRTLPGGGYVLLDGTGRARYVAPDGMLTTVAGRLGSGYTSGDGGPATSATFWANSLLPTPNGLLITDSNNHRVRAVDATTITSTQPHNGDTDASIGFTGWWPDARFECQWNDEPWAPCLSPATRSGLTGTEHAVQCPYGLPHRPRAGDDLLEPGQSPSRTKLRVGSRCRRLSDRLLDSAHHRRRIAHHRLHGDLVAGRVGLFNRWRHQLRGVGLGQRHRLHLHRHRHQRGRCRPGQQPQ